MSGNQDKAPPPEVDSTMPPAIVVPARNSGIGVHYLRYSFANVVVLLGGLVSFPVLTRLLDNTQYGIMGYFSTWLMISVAIAKFGGQHAVIRFYPHDGDASRLAHFSTNLVLLPILLSLSVWAVVAAGLLAWQSLGGGGRPVVDGCECRARKQAGRYPPTDAARGPVRRS